MHSTTSNILYRVEEFKSLLDEYSPSQASLNSLTESGMVFMVGPTASGRNTLINILVDTGRYNFVVSDTTRKPRTNNGILEQNGVEYYFLTEDEFLSGLKEGGYLEAAIIHEQQVSGISFRELNRSVSLGKISIDEIEVEGAKNVHQIIKNGLFVFLLPPTFDVWMQRLRGRGDLDEAELERRLKSSIQEISIALDSDFYHFVINNEIHEAAEAVDELANGRQPDGRKQELGINHAKQLIQDVTKHLSVR